LRTLKSIENAFPALVTCSSLQSPVIFEL